MILLIPAYEPDDKLITLVMQFKKSSDANILIVNDGSSISHNNIFNEVEKLGCIVVGYTTNQGKGYALKYGFQYILDNYSNENVVIADCDGQHSVKDILNISNNIEKDQITLGGRKFVGDNVPISSRVGNFFARHFFKLISGSNIYDTQTGLRGFHHDNLKWLISLSGNRFEYEMQMLLLASKENIKFLEIEIETIYINDNETSHFKPSRDVSLIIKVIIQKIFSTPSKKDIF